MKRIIPIFLLLIAISANALASVRPMLQTHYEINSQDSNLPWLKQRLQEIEYYGSDEYFSDLFDIHLNRKLKSFQYYNNLSVTGQPDSETMDVLFSDTAITPTQFKEKYAADPSLEPIVTLLFDDTAAAAKESGTLSFKVKVKNASSIKTIVAYEIYAVPYNAWDECMVDDVSEYSVSLVETITPGKTSGTKTFKFDNPDQIYQVWTGVHRIRYDNNTIVTIPTDEIIYTTWGPFPF